jgi:hypothetical protein
VRRPESTDGNDHLRETLAKLKSNTDAPRASAATVGYEGQLWQMADALRELFDVVAAWNLGRRIRLRDSKQHLGFSDASARKQAAVERTAPFVGLISSLLVIRAARGAHLPGSPPLMNCHRPGNRIRAAAGGERGTRGECAGSVP